MGLTQKARQAAMGAAGVAVATSGLSNCNNGGAVDPPPPPLQCNTISGGESLVATATRSGDGVEVSITSPPADFAPTIGWEVYRVVNVTGATITAITLPPAGTQQPLLVSLLLATPSTTTVSFRLEARLFGYSGSFCDVARTFSLTIDGGTITITLEPRDPLPLAARQRAEIVLAGQSGQTVRLEARTPYWGLYRARWAVTGGTLDRSEGSPVEWTLPEEPGIYQAELLLDYGPDGIGLDALMLEVG